MLSLGTEVFFAFRAASYSGGLPDRSPPPMRAATSMFLISLANILPRRASMTAFLCLVVAHLEWPDMLPLRRFGGRASACGGRASAFGGRASAFGGRASVFGGRASVFGGRAESRPD